MPWNREEAIQTTLEWGGLAILPKGAEDIDVEKRGNIFTRQFVIEFTAPENEIKNWIEQSKRLKNNIPKTIGKQNIYDVRPGEKEALGGTVKTENNKVIINMSWS